MILISDQTPELIDVLAALQSFLGSLETRTVIAIHGQAELVKALLDAKDIDYVEAPGGLPNAPAFDLGAGLRKATPLTNTDWVKESSVNVLINEPTSTAGGRTVKKEAGTKTVKICPECGEEHTNRGKFCSKTCYMKDYFRKNPKTKKDKYLGGMAPDDRIETNIDRIVANAKDQPEGANIEKTVVARGTFKARKLG